MTQQESALPATAATGPAASTRPRLLYIDNLRVVLTILVVLHHVALTYGNIPVWFYTEPAQDPSGGVLDLLVTLNQTFFMGMFFLLAGYFVPGSMDRRGRRGFVRERLVRLGAPLLLFILLIRPFVIAPNYSEWVGMAAADGFDLPFWLYYLISFDPGPMWFVEVLLVFTLAYVVIRRARERRTERAGRTVEPVTRTPVHQPLRWIGPVLAFAVGLALLTFVWRNLFPALYWPIVGLPSPQMVPQYAALFTVGVFAYRHNWLARLPDSARWYGLGLALLSLVPFLALPAPEVEVTTDAIPMGPTGLQTLLPVVAETLFATGVVLALLVFFRRLLNRGNRLTRYLSDNAFAVYVLHPLVLVGLGVALSGWEAVAVAKFAVVAALALPLCWALAGTVRAVPGAKRML